MDFLNRDERRVLRHIQAYLHAARVEAGTVIERLGTVDVLVHPSHYDTDLNCVMPHKGVAWVRREDLRAAFLGLERLGRVPRLVFLEALFPAAFQQQLVLIGLALEEVRAILVYRPLYGPAARGETLYSCLPETFSDDAGHTIETALTMTDAGLKPWLHIVRSADEGAELDEVSDDDVAALATLAQRGEMVFALARYEGVPRGAACASCRGNTAGLEVVTALPLWHGMGMEAPLIAAAVRAALARGAETIFCVAPSPELARVFYRLGFIDLTRLLIYHLPDEEPDPETVSDFAAKGESG